MLNLVKVVLFACAFSALCQTVIADPFAVYNVTLDTAPLVGHPAGPFYVELTFTDGSGVADANNTVIMSNINFGGGSVLGSPFLFGGASGSLETGVTIIDSSVLSLFSEQFAPGLQLNFRLGLTSNDDAGGTQDGFTFFVLDSSGVPIPTLAPFGDYFIGTNLGSTGPTFNTYGSDSSRPPSVGNPVSIPAPTITAVSLVPEPSTIYLFGGALAMMGVLRHRLPRSATKGKAR